MTKVDGLLRKVLDELNGLGVGRARISLYVSGPATRKQARKVLSKITHLDPVETEDWIEAARKNKTGKYEITVFYGGMEG